MAAQPRFTHPGHPVELAGIEIPPNSPVLFGIAAANRDPRRFPDPDRLQLDRRPNKHLAFGGGAHVIDLGARKSVGWTSSQEWLAAALNGEDVDA